jgi:PAS domain S-box-containing protein
MSNERELSVGEQLRELELLYRTAPVGLCLMDRELRYVRINERLAEIHGTPVAAHVGRTLREVIPQMADVVEPILRKVIDTGEPELDVELRGMTPAQPGVERVWRSHHFPLKAPDGAVEALSIVVVEETVRYRAERALKESERTLRLITDGVPALIASVDRNERYRFTNAAYDDWFGLPRNRTEGRHIREVLGEEMHGAVRHRVEAALSGQEQVFEVARTFPDDTKRYLEVRLIPDIRDDGDVLGFYVLGMDVTKARLERQVVEASEKRLRRLVETTNVIPWEADASTWRFTYVGPQAETILGYPVEQWYEDGFWVQHIAAEDRDWAIEFCDKCSKAGKDYEFDYRMILASGKTIWLHDLVSVVMEAGKPKILRGFMIDITNRKRAQEELEKSEATLRKSDRKTRELTGKLILARDADRKRIAEELHEDLTQRLAGTAMTLTSVCRNLPAPDAVRDELVGVQKLVSDLTYDMTRLSRLLHPLTIEDMGLLGALSSLCRDFPDDGPIRLEASLPKELPEVPDDVAMCVYRVAEEALRNVVEHSGARNVTLTLVRDDGLRLSVSDDGVGFDTKLVRGEGMGLASSEHRVQLLKGSFQLESRPGTGTTLAVTVPLQANSLVSELQW